MDIDTFIQDGQDAKVVDKIHGKLVGMLTSGEFIQYIALQKKPGVTLLPDSIAISNNRIFLCEFTRLGWATNFEIFAWSEMEDVMFKEEIFGAKVTFVPFVGDNFIIRYIPKVQARKLYQLIQAALEGPTSDNIKESAPATVKQKPIASTAKPEPPVPTEVPRTPPIVKEKPVVEKKPIASTAKPEPPVPTEVPRTPPIVKEKPVAKESKPVVTERKKVEAVQQPQIPAVKDQELKQKIKKLESLYDRQLITKSEFEQQKSELLSQR